jgi:hypothetical protein
MLHELVELFYVKNNFKFQILCPPSQSAHIYFCWQLGCLNNAMLSLVAFVIIYYRRNDDFG